MAIQEEYSARKQSMTNEQVNGLPMTIGLVLVGNVKWKLKIGTAHQP